MTTGLAGIDGHDEARLRGTGAARLPARLAGICVAADGRPVGLALPSLDERGAAEAWRAALGPGPYFVRFLDRAAEPSLDRVQRLARLGEVWVDCAVDGVDGALDLLIAGASRLVLWGDDPDLLAAVGDSAALGWDVSRPLEPALQASTAHEVPLVTFDPVADLEAPGLYSAPRLPWTGAVELTHVGAVGDDGDDE